MLCVSEAGVGEKHEKGGIISKGEGGYGAHRGGVPFFLTFYAQ